MGFLNVHLSLDSSHVGVKRDIFDLGNGHPITSPDRQRRRGSSTQLAKDLQSASTISSDGDMSAWVSIDSDVNSIASQVSDAGVLPSEEVSVSEGLRTQQDKIPEMIASISS